MMLRSVNGVAAAAAATPYPARSCTLCHGSTTTTTTTSSSNPSTSSFSNIQYGSNFHAGNSVVKLPGAAATLNGNRKKKNMMMKMIRPPDAMMMMMMKPPDAMIMMMMMRPSVVASWKDIETRTPHFLSGQHPLRYAPLKNLLLGFENKASSSVKLRINAGKSASSSSSSGADAYSSSHENLSPKSIPEHATDKKNHDYSSTLRNNSNFSKNRAQGVSEEAARKALGILRETASQLRQQAEKARALLAASAQELPIRGKENLSYVAENGPDPVRDIAETALNAHYPPENASGKPGSKIHDFCLGIPYGVLLVVGGLLQVVITGSTASIRFGVLLGGLLLALTVTSLKAWKRRESSLPYIQGQAIITGAIFFRFIRRYAETKTVFPTGIIAITSAAMLAFYVYVFLSGGNPPKEMNSESSY